MGRRSGLLVGGRGGMMHDGLEEGGVRFDWFQVEGPDISTIEQGPSQRPGLL